MINKKIDIFEFNSNLGLRKQRGKESSVYLFPKQLRKIGFYKFLNSNNIFIINKPIYTMEFDENTETFFNPLFKKSSLEYP